MPLISSHVFANHKGGAGKSSLLFHTVSQCAKNNPDQKFCVMDYSLMGDISVLFFGGERQQEAIYKTGHYTDMEESDMFKTVTAMLKYVNSKAATAGGFMGKLRASMGGAGNQGMEEYMVRVCDINSEIPDNVYLIPTNLHIEHPEYNAQEITAIVGMIKDSFKASSTEWRVFCDSDGDLQITRSYTRIALGLCQHSIVPIEVSRLDYNRCLHQWEEMDKLTRDAPGVFDTRVNMVIFNKVQAKSGKFLGHKHITPMKNPVANTIIDLSELTLRLAKVHPNLFDASPEDEEEFKNETFAVMRLLGNPITVGENLGVPICNMSVSKHKSNLYSLDNKALDAARENIDDFIRLLRDDA